MSNVQNCINCETPLKTLPQKSPRLTRRPSEGPDLKPSNSADCMIVESTNFLVGTASSTAGKTKSPNSKIVTSITKNEESIFKRPAIESKTLPIESKSLGLETKPPAMTRRSLKNKPLEFDAKNLGGREIEFFGIIEKKSQENTFLEELKMFRVSHKFKSITATTPKGLFFGYGNVIGFICFRKLGKNIRICRLKMLQSQIPWSEDSNEITPLLISQSQG